MNRYTAMTGLLAVAFADSAFADGAAAGQEAMNQVAAMFTSGVSVTLAVIGALVFAIAAYAVIMKMVAAASGRGTWGEVLVPFIFGAGAVIIIGYLVATGTAEVAAINAGAGAGGD